MPDADLTALERLASRAAAKAAEELHATAGAASGVRSKSWSTDMVTDMDVAAEHTVQAVLLAERPGDTVLGEESSAAGDEQAPGDTGAAPGAVRWVVDPIDGTTNFVYGLAGFAVSVAAEQAGRIVAAAVVDPVRGEMFSAHHGGGARCNGEPIRVRQASDLSLSLLATGFSYDPQRRRRQAEALVGVLPHVRDIRRIGAAATDLCNVACGRVDAFYEVGLQYWDYAAGGLIASEAGAVVGGLADGVASSRFVLAASPGIAEELRRLLASSGAHLAWHT